MVNFICWLLFTSLTSKGWSDLRFSAFCSPTLLTPEVLPSKLRDGSALHTLVTFLSPDHSSSLNSTCVHQFFVAMAKMPNKNNLEEEKFNFDSSWLQRFSSGSAKSIALGSSWGREHPDQRAWQKKVTHLMATRKQREGSKGGSHRIDALFQGRCPGTHLFQPCHTCLELPLT